MSVMETLNTRRTYRRFAQKPVSQDVVDDMVEALRLSSCGANRQAVKLVVVQSPEMVKKVHPLVKWAAYLPPEQGTPKADEQPVMLRLPFSFYKLLLFHLVMYLLFESLHQP